MNFTLRTVFAAVILSFLLLNCSSPEPEQKETLSTHDQLVDFFFEWREFHSPEFFDGVPDYSENAMRKQHQEMASWQKRLHAFDTTNWPIKHQVDWFILYAEINGMDFDHRVLRPWQRDPAYYVWFFSYLSDVPAREGPHIYGAVELPSFQQPLSPPDASSILDRLSKAEAVFEQARKNLTGNGRDLWVTGIRSIYNQSADLNAFADKVESTYPDLAVTAREASKASDRFASWLEEEAPKKTGPSGVGKENYSWYLRHVHLLPYSWEDEKVLLERELARAHSALRMVEHQNRKLTQLEKVNTAEAHLKLLTDGVNEYMAFLDEEEFITVKPYMMPAMMEQIGTFTPSETLRGFFSEIDYRDPMPMRAHNFHWIDKAREALEPHESPIRRTPLLYNIFDSRAEGLATAMEELVLHAGLLENRPRAKELVYIMLIQRAARGLGGLYQHSLDMTFDEATQFASKWVPRGLLPADGGTIQVEEQFYLEQPGYGSSYVIGKLDIDKLIAEYGRQRNDQFILREFMDEFNTKGIIPMSLIYWEMTGNRDMLNEALNSPR